MNTPIRLVDAPRLTDRRGVPLEGPVRLSPVLPVFLGEDLAGLFPQVATLEDGVPVTDDGHPVLIRAGVVYRCQPDPGEFFSRGAFLVVAPS